MPVASVLWGPLCEAEHLTRLAAPAFPGVDLAAWASVHAAEVRQVLDVFGAVLFRGFGVTDENQLEAVSRKLCTKLVGYMERRSPRVPVTGDVFTSTIYPSDQYIHFHNEKSYAHEWPLQLHFCCVRPADQGGLTPVADSRRVLERLSPGTRKPFLERGVRYVRYFDQRFGLSWQETFQTSDRAEVERFCTSAGIHFLWQGNGRLRTWQDRHAVAVHPRTGESVWFNQAHYFHPRALGPHANMLRLQDDEGHLPQEAFYGGGDPISDDTVDEIIEAYRAEQVAFSWERGDFFVVDNMKVAHSRTPFTGQRLILLTLGDAYSPQYSGGGTV